MSYELSPRKVVEDQITNYNDLLSRLATKAKAETGFVLHENPAIPTPDIDPATTTAAFWNHFIGSEIRGVAVDYQNRENDPTIGIDPNLIRDCQQRAQALTKVWLIHPSNPNTPIQSASCETFITANASFDWATSKELFLELDELVSGLGHSYSILHGII